MTIDFQENPTVLLQENGWGKSTLAAFIRIMFYGFANEKKRGDALERERVRFKPWQGGIYGGELEFETNGRRYLLNRTFGAKEAEDTFALYDAKTNLKTTDFSENIGEELFQINRESFLRTIFISQNDCVTATTDSINAKIGNLEDRLNDVDHYEEVQKVLKDLQNAMSPTRKTGAVRREKEEIDGLKNEIRRKELVDRAIAELEERIADCQSEREKLLLRREDLRGEWTYISKYHELLAKKESYERILKQRDEKRAEKEKTLQSMGGQAPDKGELKEILNVRNEMMGRESDMRAHKLSGEECAELSGLRERFADGLPDDELLKRGKNLTGQMEELRTEQLQNGISEQERQELGQLRERFGKSAVREEDIEECLNGWNACMEKKSALGTKKATLSSLRTLEESVKAPRRSTAGTALFLIPAAMVLLGAAICFVEPLAGAVLLVAGAALAVILFILSAVRRRKEALDRETQNLQTKSGADLLEREIAQDEEQIAQETEQVRQFLEGLGIDGKEDDRSVRELLYALKNDAKRQSRLEAKCRDYEEKKYEERLQEMRGQQREWLAPYYSEWEIEGKKPYELFLDLEKRREKYLRLEEKENRYHTAQSECGALRVRILDFLAKHVPQTVQDIDDSLGMLSVKLSAYESLTQEVQKYESEREAFEKSCDINEFGQLEEKPSRTASEVKEELEALEEKLDHIQESMNAYRDQLDDKQLESEELEAQKEKMEQLYEQYEKDSRYYRNLELTSEYLAKAKESFSAKYMAPIMDAFRRNFERMSHLPGDAFRMDANIRLTQKQAGEQRDTRALSAGSQDLIGIAFRMALIEVMYQKEKPFVLFDDSFTNLDDEKLEYAKRFLGETAKEYQVIYFTCHESRRL